MKIDKLHKEAVRSTRKVDDVVHLSVDELTQVVGSVRSATDEGVPSEICAIHDYYIDDSVG